MSESAVPRAPMPPGTRLLIVDNDAAYFPTHRIVIAEGARAAGCEVHVALPLDSGAAIADRFPDYTFHDVPFDRTGQNVVRDLATLVALYALYRKMRPAIVHHFSLKPVLYGGWAAAAAGVPGVVNAMTGLGMLFGDAPRMQRLRRLVVRALRSACNRERVRMIFQNDADRELFAQLGIGLDGHAVVIPGAGIQVDRFPVRPEPPGIPLVLFASRMLWTKGVGEFVAAARILRERGVVARFVLAGDADSHPESVPPGQLQAWNDAGAIEWWGHRDDMADVLASAHVVCLPTVYREGVPKILIEAACAGRPVITTDAPGCRDIVREGYNGMLIPAGDAGALADALGRLLREPDLRREMGKNGHRLVIERFAADRVVGETLTVYASLTD